MSTRKSKSRSIFSRLETYVKEERANGSTRQRTQNRTYFLYRFRDSWYSNVKVSTLPLVSFEKSLDSGVGKGSCKLSGLCRGLEGPDSLCAEEPKPTVRTGVDRRGVRRDSGL